MNLFGTIPFYEEVHWSLFVVLAVAFAYGFVKGKRRARTER